jgi:hypothetical protein
MEKCDIKNFNEDFYLLIINLQIFVTNSKNIPQKRSKKKSIWIDFQNLFSFKEK